MNINNRIGRVKPKYRKGNIYQFFERGGSKAHDSTNNSYADWVSGTALWDFTPDGKCVNLNNSPRIQINGPDPTSNRFTIITRLTIDSVDNSDPRIYYRGNSGNDADYGVRLDLNFVSSSTGNARFRIQDSNTIYTAEITSTALSTSHHAVMAGRYDGTNVECWLFIDGQAPLHVSSAHTGSIDQSSSWVTYVGGDPVSLSLMDGRLFWLYTWPQALPTSEIYKIAYNPSSIFITEEFTPLDTVAAAANRLLLLNQQNAC